ncbi:MAG TPA: hypothetical protein ENO18_03420, partial [Caldithrix sp.]|nr:hypothetical protein [Caldithrix sp.]
DDTISMSVIVQEMVNAKKSGVLFTKNPVNAKDEFYVEMVDDFGEALVSGQANPETMIIKKDEKPADILSKELKKAAEIIERSFENPMDIEWAWDGSILSILQARPIKIEIKRILPHEFWTRANIGEIIPKPLTPLSWSIFKEVIFKSYRIKYYSLIDRFFTNIIHLIPRKPPVEASPKEIDGYLYLNLDTILKSFGGEPWVNKHILEFGLGFQIPDVLTIPQKSFSERLVSSIKGLIFLIELFLPWLSMENRLEKFINNHLINKPNDKNELSTILNTVRFLFGWHMAITARCFSHLGFFKYITEKYKQIELQDEKLITLLSVYQSNSMVLDNQIKNKIIKELQFEIKKAEKINGYQPFNHSNEFKSFMEKYGHRSVNEFELSQQGWNENYDGLIKFLNDSDFNHKIKNKTGANNFLEKVIIGRLEKAIFLREILKSQLIKQYRDIRYYFLNKSSHLYKQNLIHNINDIFYLYLDEIEEIENNQIPIDNSIETRKQNVIRQSSEQVPYTIYD